MTNSPNSTASGIGHALASWLTQGGSGALERMQPKEEAPATGGLDRGFPVPIGGEPMMGEGIPSPLIYKPPVLFRQQRSKFHLVPFCRPPLAAVIQFSGN